MKYGIEHNLVAIIALCNNPHWTPSRRWRIAELAQESLREMQTYKKMNPALAEMDDECEGSTDD